MKLTDATLLAMLEALIDTGAPLDPADTYLGVATALDDLDEATVQADVTYATGAMATRKLITAWGDPYKLADGRWAVDSGLLTFRPASSAEAQTLTHWTLSDAATAGVLKAFGQVSPNANLPDQFSEWGVVVRVTLDPDARWSAEVQFNG